MLSFLKGAASARRVRFGLMEHIAPIPSLGPENSVAPATSSRRATEIMEKKMRTLRIILLGTLVLALSTFGFGQAISGDLTGTVTDKTGAVIPGATVEATNQATGVKTTTTATSAG